MNKKLLIAFLTILSLSVFFVSCKNNSKNSGESYTLKMRLAPGDNFKQEADMKMDMNIDMMGQSIKMNMSMTGLTDFLVAADTMNLKRINTTYESLKMSMNMSGLPGADDMNMDSVMNQEVKRMEGKPVTMLMNDKNEIIDVIGFDSLMADANIDMATEAQLTKFFSKEQMNGMFGMMFQMYPDKPVKLGESWEREIEIYMADIKMKMKGTYTLLSVKDGVAHIDVVGKFLGKGSMIQEETNVDLDMDGNQKGKIAISLADGYLKNSDYMMDINAGINMMGQSVPMKIKGVYLIKRK